MIETGRLERLQPAIERLVVGLEFPNTKLRLQDDCSSVQVRLGDTPSDP